MAKVIKRVALKTLQHSQRCLITLKTRLIGGKIWLEAQSKAVQTDPLEGSQFIGIRILDSANALLSSRHRDGNMRNPTGSRTEQILTSIVLEGFLSGLGGIGTVERKAMATLSVRW